MSSDPAFHPRGSDAIEFVLGTLSAKERTEFERLLDGDDALRAVVSYWEAQLFPLSMRVQPVPPPPTLRPLVMNALPRPVVGQTVPEPAARGGGTAEIVRLRRSLATWRGAAGISGLLAASLAGIIVLDAAGSVRPPVGLVAVVNRSGELPALIVRVDSRAGTVQVRSLATETPAGRSLELWSIVGAGPPHSLGVLAATGTRVAVPEADRPRLDGATLAVTVEPQGGSPTGGPTGAIVYSGKLVPEPK